MIRFLSGPIWKDARELQMPYQVGGASDKQDLDAFNSGAMICVIRLVKAQFDSNHRGSASTRRFPMGPPSPPAPVLHSPTLRNLPGSSGGEQTDPDQEEKNNKICTRHVDRK
ncbi:puff-specific protein Bx42-like [Culex quinquefasciatus]|uniref:puff-specific protein Bx42-like n=1 Tax=Culex quinquefasciatus TaxID=7176 RepID=UPI0018E30072|nr:puff-specific protein Bx42-like [Culex quinquefasciatus]XP_038119300.1 puff-specific protein Bx42-like [Culex quinquefasciatus]XP_039448867.1 puff-specific protein Bx42-like [Culex pipiens pallens]